MKKCITSDDNAMLSGSDGQNYQAGGGAFVIVGLGSAPIVSPMLSLLLLTTVKI